MKSNYCGVIPYGKRWRAQVSWKHKILNLGDWQSERTAAWVVDFAKFILYGINAEHWHHRTKKPNFLPTIRKIGVQGTEGDYIIQKLLDKLCLTPELAISRAADYDKVAREIYSLHPQEVV